MRYKLDEIVDVTMGQSPKSEYYNSEAIGMPFLQGNRTFGIKFPTFDTYTKIATKTAKAGDVIMSVRAPVGDLNITPLNVCLGRGVCSLHMKNGNQEFLYYMMKYYMPYLLNKESGTVFGSINRNDIISLEVDIPADSKIQKKIARYLTMVDEKIELNNKINNNLEQQMQVVFNKFISERLVTSKTSVENVVLTANTGADAIQKAPI
ncbi:MAG: restriction endonuclease subunit S, partial [Lachnospiraceae bacterium]|nr:restriction endonuclease subunit S [Lachnospiraceae bacterium]